MGADHDEVQSLRKRVHDMADVVQTTVTRTATIDVNVSNLVHIFTEHKDDSKTFMGDTRESLAQITKQVTETNGRVNGHDDHFTMNDREIRDIKDTLSRVLWLFLGLNVSVIGGVVVYWVTHQ